MEFTYDERARAVVLVEGLSDRRALEALAARRGRDLGAEGVSVVSIGGATNIRSALDVFGPRGRDVRLAGLCDAAEEGDFRRGLEQAGLGADLTRDGMEDLGFYVCVADLEDELTRCLGDDAVERVLEEQGDLVSFRTFQKQPEWRGRTTEEQLRRFLGTGSGRKTGTAALLVGALDLTRVPRPLEFVSSRTCEAIDHAGCRSAVCVAFDQARDPRSPSIPIHRLAGRHVVR